MKIVINNNGKRIPATLDVVDGVMIVSPVKEKDIAQFKDGDVVVYRYGEDATTIAILQGEVDTISKYLFIEDYVSLDSVEGLLLDSNYTDAATDVRYATEEEKHKLFDALEKSGYRWDAERREVVQFKWKPYIGDIYYYPMFQYCSHLFKSHDCIWADLLADNDIYSKGWCFKTKEECEAFCERLNQAIMEIKP